MQKIKKMFGMIVLGIMLMLGAGFSCGGENLVECDINQDCPNGEYCTSFGTCAGTQSCSSNANCNQGEVCASNGFCILEN